MGYHSVYIMFNCMHILRKTSFQIFDAQWNTHTHTHTYEMGKDVGRKNK